MERTPLVYVLIVTTLLLLALFRAFLERNRRWNEFFSAMHVVEVGLIGLLVASLIFFGCLQIVLRNFFHSGIIWADPLMRHVVLWLGCLGGAMATTRVRHISIDVLTRVLPEGLRDMRDRVIHLGTAVAASLLGLAALRLVVDERDFGEVAFLGVQVWVLQLILPVAFFLITYRSFVNMILARRPQPLEWEDLGDRGDSPAES